jgi:hypothetical protein
MENLVYLSFPCYAGWSGVCCKWMSSEFSRPFLLIMNRVAVYKFVLIVEVLSSSHSDHWICSKVVDIVEKSKASASLTCAVVMLTHVLRSG